jgi:hypothetical protein
VCRRRLACECVVLFAGLQTAQQHRDITLQLAAGELSVETNGRKRNRPCIRTGSAMKTTGCGLGGRVRKLRRAWPAIMLLVFAIECPSAYADDPKPPNIVFADEAAVTLSPDGSNAFKFDISVKNSGAKRDASLNLLSDHNKRCDHADMEPKGITVSSNAVAVIYVQITNVTLPATCYIELVTGLENDAVTLKQIKLTQQSVTQTVLKPLYICFGISVLIAIVAGFAVRHRLGVKSPLFKIGPPSWDFAKSWTSNTTLVGAIISTALTLSALPELTKYASKSGYSTLVLLFSLAVIIAPFVFVAFRSGEIGKDPDNQKKDAVLYQGYLWAFLLSCAITLFAGLAQLVVLFLLLAEVFQEYPFWSFSWSLIAGSILTFLLSVALCWYVGNSMYFTIQLQVLHKEAADKEKATFETDEEKTRAVRDAKGPLLPWSVL